MAYLRFGGLRRFLDESPDGIETPVLDNGWRLSEGIRRRIALARALMSDRKIAIIDEPTESFDAEGCAAVHGVLAEMAKLGRTIIIMSHDATVVKGTHAVLDLNAKPAPEIRQISAPETAKPLTATPAPEQSLQEQA